jgi:lipid II:glycine glycyltransferase (peptidoglycan interpeptide bridge formation enzyme)
VENLIAIIETPIEKVMYYHKMSESLKASADYHMAFYNEQIERLEEKLKTNPKNRKAAEEAIEKNREWVSELKQTMKTIEVNEKLFSNYMMQKGLLDILVGISEDILEKKKEDVYEPRERKPDPSYS